MQVDVSRTTERVSVFDLYSSLVSEAGGQMIYVSRDCAQ